MIDLLIIETAKKAIIATWSCAFISLITAEFIPNIPESLAIGMYVLANVLLIFGFFLLGYLLASMLEEDSVSFEEYKNRYNKFRKESLIRKARLAKEEMIRNTNNVRAKGGSLKFKEGNHEFASFGLTMKKFNTSSSDKA